MDMVLCCFVRGSGGSNMLQIAKRIHTNTFEDHVTSPNIGNATFYMFGTARTLFVLQIISSKAQCSVTKCELICLQQLYLCLDQCLVYAAWDLKIFVQSFSWTSQQKVYGRISRLLQGNLDISANVTIGGAGF